MTADANGEAKDVENQAAASTVDNEASVINRNTGNFQYWFEMNYA